MREDIISFFEKGIFPFKGNVFKTEEEKEEIKEKEKEEYINDVVAFIGKESKIINNDLFHKIFDLAPVDLVKKVFKTKMKKKTVSL